MFCACVGMMKAWLRRHAKLHNGEAVKGPLNANSLELSPTSQAVPEGNPRSFQGLLRSLLVNKCSHTHGTWFCSTELAIWVQHVSACQWLDASELRENAAWLYRNWCWRPALHPTENQFKNSSSGQSFTLQQVLVSNNNELINETESSAMRQLKRERPS